MQKLVSLRIGWTFSLFAFLDIICAGIGMGVPILCILFGFPVGWYLASRVTIDSLDMKPMFGQLLRCAALTSGFTFVIMAVVWGPSIAMLFDPTADLANYGIPMILYEPRASFIGWMVLMIFISPFLQFLMTLFGSHVTMLRRLSRNKEPDAEQAKLE